MKSRHLRNIGFVATGAVVIVSCVAVRSNYAAASDGHASKVYAYTKSVSTSTPTPSIVAGQNLLATRFNNVATSNDTTPGAGNFDGYHDSYSAQALQTAGFSASGQIVANGVSFQWPNVAVGMPDNVLAQGQSITLTTPLKGATLGFLGANALNSSSGTATLTYADGTVQTFQLGMSDWTLNGGSIQPLAGDSIAATLPYRNTSNGRQLQYTYVFYTGVTLKTGKALARVTLPAASSFGPLHLFAMSVGGSTPAVTTQMTSTPTAAVATNTATNTATPVPSATSTATTAPSATSVPATMTPTSVPLSATSVPSTATPTSVPPAPSATPVPSATAASPQVTGPGVALGAMVDGAGEDPTLLDAYNALVYPNGGGHAASANFFHNWSDTWSNSDGTPGNMFDAPLASALLARGAAPFLSWGSCDQTTDATCSYASIAGGSHDPYLASYAKQVAAWGHTLYLRFDWEANGNWYGFGYGWGNHGNTPAGFAAMWRHVHDVFAANGATNVKWVWCPNTTPGGDAFDAAYPGSAYVDDVCLDGYNWGTVTSPTGWHSFTQEFQQSYTDITALAPDKPLIIGETASAEQGGDKAAWVASAFTTEIPTLFPRIKAVLWFDANKETDWRVNSSPAALAAYQQAAAAPAYHASMP